jgi:hypothetical protein
MTVPDRLSAYDQFVERYLTYVEVLVHRVLAQHAPHERCVECPDVAHCG